MTTFLDNYPPVDYTRKTTANGYEIVYVPTHPRADKKGYFYRHIIVAELKLGRFISRSERVHHGDHDKRNNAPDNMEVLVSNSQHCKLHAAERGPAPIVDLVCPQCQGIFQLQQRSVRSRRKTNKLIFCSKQCSARYYALNRTSGSCAEVVHGTSNAYGYHRCRCTICREGVRIRQREYVARRHGKHAGVAER